MTWPFTPDEMMTVAAARLLWDGCVCFVGIGLPSAAANLARHTHAPDIVLIYESGTVGARPDVLPLSIGDGELADTATAVVPLPEIFAYWLQGGRIDVGFLGAAQIDRFAQPQQHGHRRLRDARGRACPAAAARPEIATNARQVFVVLKQIAAHVRAGAGFLQQRRASSTGHGARARSRRPRRRAAGGHHRPRRAASPSREATNSSSSRATSTPPSIRP